MMRELEQLKGQMKMMVQLMTAMVSSRGIEPTKLLPQVQQHKEEMDKQVKKNSEFSVVEQLNKMLAQISILGLLIASEAHRNALLKILNEAHVASNISPENFQNLVGRSAKSCSNGPLGGNCNSGSSQSAGGPVAKSC